MKMKEISLAAFICCWFAAVAGKAIALDLYGFDVPKQYPKAYSAYKAVIPSQYKKISWMQRLDGTSGPLKDIDVEGAPLYSSGCASRTIAEVTSLRYWRGRTASAPPPFSRAPITRTASGSTSANPPMPRRRY